MWVSLLLAACAPPGPAQEPCAAPPTEEIAAFCAFDRAEAAGRTGDRVAALAACGGVGEERWRHECAFRAAEGLAYAGELDEALLACAEATRFSRMCVGHVAWLRSADLVASGPADASAQAAIDALMASLPAGAFPDAGAERGIGSKEVARGAAWHGVYAGSGLADPAAARGASTSDAPFARGAFAWEATRLLGPGSAPGELVTAVLALWRGERPPLTGPPLDEACWEARLIPRKQLGYAGLRTVRTWSGGERFVADEPETDLQIAVLEARWAAGQDFDAAYVRGLLATGPVELQRTAARFAAIDALGFPDLPGAVPNGALLELARSVRAAAERGFGGRQVAPADKARCGA